MRYFEEEEEENMSDPEGASLQELLKAMGAMQAKRLPKGEPGGVSITIAAGGDKGGDMPGMDPRLAELIRKKKEECR